MMVKFTKNHTPYMAGETAAFPDDRGRRLIGSGVAVEYVTKPIEAPATVVVEPQAVVTKGFDPSAADAAALRAFLTERGVSVHHRTGLDKLREIAAAELARD